MNERERTNEREREKKYVRLLYYASIERIHYNGDVARFRLPSEAARCAEVRANACICTGKAPTFAFRATAKQTRPKRTFRPASNHGNPGSALFSIHKFRSAFFLSHFALARFFFPSSARNIASTSKSKSILYFVSA